LIEDHSEEGITSSISGKSYDEAITTVNTSKGRDAYIKHNLDQQYLVKNHKGAKRILVVDDEYDIGLTLKVVDYKTYLSYY
jgi:hypothetical protein